MKTFVLFFSLLFAVSASAQRNIVDNLQANRPGQGKVTIHQSAFITSLIGVKYSIVSSADKRNVLKARGFRVQVYAGNNSRSAREEATSIAEKIRKDFPEMPVYTYFQPPRWLCRVGDFKSIEEAHATMRMLKESGILKEVAIVREQINIPIE